MFSTAAKNAALDAMWGASHAASMPATFQLGLLTNDPRLSAPVEVSGPGYARISGTNDGTFWDAAASGVKTSKVQTFPNATGAWSTARFWGIWVTGELWDFGRLAEDIAVTAAGAGPAIKLRRTFASGLV